MCAFEAVQQEPQESQHSTEPELCKCVLEMTLCCPSEFSDQHDSFQLEIVSSLS